MYQKTTLIRKGLIAAVAVAAMSSGQAMAANTVDGCVQTILKEAQKFGQKKANAVRKCEDGVLKGGTTGPCPDAGNAQKIADAMAKAEASIAKKCDELYDNAACTGAGTPDACCTGLGEGTCFDAGMFGYPDLCPRAECVGAIADVADLGACVTCNVMEIIDNLGEETYGTLEDPSTDKAVLNCQRTYAKEIIQAYRKISKARQKCEDGVIKGKVVGPCPDAGTTEKVDATLTKLAEKIDKKCGDAATREAALNLGKAFGSTGFAGAGDDVTDYAEGIAASQVLSSSQSAVCGNAAIDPGETCDDGNTRGDNGTGASDPCPGDCNIAACAVGGSGSATVSFAAPNGENIAAATVLVYYDESKVKVQEGTFAAAGPFTGETTNDLDYAFRSVLLDASLFGATSGAALTFDYSDCGGAVAASDFDCYVVDASDDAFAAVDGVTCTVAP